MHFCLTWPRSICRSYPAFSGLKKKEYYALLQKLAKPSLYDHVTKYSSKKRKSEINATIEEFALEIEKETGRKDVKIKIEIVEEEDMVDLEVSVHSLNSLHAG